MCEPAGACHSVSESKQWLVLELLKVTIKVSWQKIGSLIIVTV